MSDEEALLAAILANPAEDTPRLVFADYLDENAGLVGRQADHERAEFIRVQVELARLPDADRNTPHYRALLIRFRQLIADHAEAWSEALGVPRTRAIFRRGFIEEITFAPEEVPPGSNPALVREPLRCVTVTVGAGTTFRPAPCAPVLAKLAAWPGRGRFDALDLRGLSIPDDAVEPFLAAPVVANVRVLAWSLSPTGVMKLAESPHLTKLESLELGQVRLSAEEAFALARTRGLPKLRHLDLWVRCDALAEDEPDRMKPAVDALTARYGRGVYLSRW